MTLQAKLDAFKEDFKKTAPQAAQEVMETATQELRSSGILDQTIKVGDKLPPFTLRNQDGLEISSAELLQDGPLVVNFFRGIWCPYCNIELEALNEALPDFTAAGASFVTIAPQLEKSAKRNKESKKLSFDILVDEGNQYARELGLVFALPQALREVYTQFGIVLPDHNGDDSWTLPMPARLVIDQKGVVVYANINPDYTVRPEPVEVTEVLNGLAAEQVA